MLAEAAGAHTELEAAHCLRAAFRALVRRFSVSERANDVCCGMSVAQAATLQTLSSEGGLRQGELGRRLGVTPSTLTRNLSRLEEAGLVERRPEAGDRRAMHVVLTQTGRAAAERVELAEVRFAQDILERLPAQRRGEVLRGLGELLGALREATESCCPGAYDHLMRAVPGARSAGRGGDCDDEGGCCG